MKSRLPRAPQGLRRAVPFVLALALVVAATAPAAWAKVFSPQTFTLKNGMQVVLIENHRAPVVTQMVFYKAGAADETPGQSGVAHFLEHLMFKGTTHYKSGEFSRLVAKNGGHENAFTTYDYTAFFQTIASNRLPMVMRMESDRMTNLIVTPAQVKPELQVVLEEQRMRIANNPAALLDEQVNAAQFLSYPYHRPVIGWKSDIEALNAKDVRAFYKKWYAPNNAILVVEGDVTMKKLKPLAEKYYGVIPPNPNIERHRPDAQPQIASRTVALRDARVTQPQWSRQWMAPSDRWGESKLRYGLEVLDEILGADSTSRLYKALVVDNHLAVSAGSWYSGAHIGPGTFGIAVQPRPGVDMHKAVDKALEVVRDLLANGVGKKELADAKQRLRYQAIYARDDFGTGARVLGKALALGESVNDVENWPERIAAVTADDVMAAAKAVFHGPKPVTSMLLAKPAG